MKKKCVLLILSLLLFLPQLKAQSSKPAFRIIGYFRGNLEHDVDKIHFRKITHLNVAFINPDAAGTFVPVTGLQALVKTAHARHVKVLASFGGGMAPAYFSDLIGAAHRTAFIANLLKLMLDYKLDGIDVDLEGALITADYDAFIADLAPAIKSKGLLTAAVATAYGERYSLAALQQFDFINVMSYDKTGPWKPENAGPHAPFAMATADLIYWNTAKGVAKEKLSLGVPFYGYSFGPVGAGSMMYREIIQAYPGAENKDEVTMSDGGFLYYNGILTIQNKTKLALAQAGGVMIWQLLQDTTGKKSLLDVIHKQIKATR
jgi:chitinase